MRPIATDVALSVVFLPVCVCLSTLGTRVGCEKNGWTDRDFMWGWLTCIRQRSFVRSLRAGSSLLWTPAL